MAAIRVGEYYKAHALIAFGLMGQDRRLNQARKIWIAIEQSGWTDFKQSDLWQRVRRQYAEPSDLRETLRLLESMNYIREIAPIESLKSRGKKPSPLFAINPLTRTANTVCTAESGNPAFVEPNNVQPVQMYSSENFKKATISKKRRMVPGSTSREKWTHYAIDAGPFQGCVQCTQLRWPNFEYGWSERREPAGS